MRRVRSEVRWMGVALVIVISSCAIARPPEPLDISLLGCYAVSFEGVPESIADSLGYDFPSVIRLGDARVGTEAFAVVPSDFEYHPMWTRLDQSPASRWAHMLECGGPCGEDGTIDGDSIDVVYPGPLGKLVLRVGGRTESTMSGRAEWVVTKGYREPMPIEGSFVQFTRTHCGLVAQQLVRRNGLQGS